MILAVLFAVVSPTPPALAAPAAAVVRRYYGLIAIQRYRDAYRLWDRGGAASGHDYAGFRRGFANTATTRVTVGMPSDPEGAAGSAFVTVPAIVEARLAGGTRQRFTGRYVLRRVNDVPGSSAEARRWHLYSARLRAMPTPG